MLFIHYEQIKILSIMKRFSFFRPIVFRRDNTFVPHDLAQNWLKRLNFSKVGNNYSLHGDAPSGGTYNAYFDQDGHFLFLKMVSWSRASQKQSEVHISHITQYIDRAGAVWTSFRCYAMDDGYSIKT